MNRPNMESGKEVQPFFFREQSSQLYACFHSCSPVSPGNQATLICNPIGHEYERCHRAIRQLATQLTRSGHDAMRFDYCGTGDSAGDYVQASYAQWQKDLTDSIIEIKQITKRQELNLIGMRLGATLATEIAAVRNDIKSLVLYAPVFDGNTLLSEWQQEQKKYNQKFNISNKKHNTDAVLGYPVSHRLREELIHQLRLIEPSPSLRRVLIISDQVDNSLMQQMKHTLGMHGAKVCIEQDNALAIWKREPFEAIVPFKLFRRIIQWLNEES